MQGVLRSKGFTKVLDLSSAEKEGKAFEGTGVLVLDRINGVAYVALSERANREIAEHWVQRLGYKASHCPFWSLHIAFLRRKLKVKALT